MILKLENLNLKGLTRIRYKKYAILTPDIMANKIKGCVCTAEAINENK